MVGKKNKGRNAMAKKFRELAEANKMEASKINESDAKILAEMREANASRHTINLD